MAFTATELVESGVWSFSEGKPQVAEKFVCYNSDPDNDGQLAHATLYKIIKTNSHQCGVYGTAPNCINGIGSVDSGAGLPLKSFDIQPVSERIGTFEVTLNYAAGSLIVDDDEGEPGFQEFSMTVGRTFVDGWRGGPDYPAPGTPNDDDINGEGLDSQGEPVSVPVLTQELSMGLIMTGEQLKVSLALWRSHANTRNDNAYLGADRGTLLFPGATVNRIGPDLYSTTIVLYWDEFYHCRQVPLREADGSPKISEGKAETVYWRQPFDVLAEFDFGVALP
tara:strand:+ start:53 stop:889 length:837 start_codon:yes stop_codon:yes gene_type:complete